MVTKTLVVFCIRTRRLFFRSKPGEFLTVMNIAAVAVAIGLPFLPWGVGVWFGFVAPPPSFFVFLVIATLAYLGLVEISKLLFYRFTSGTRPSAAK
jgi:Mg2+-importing ATPase